MNFFNSALSLTALVVMVIINGCSRQVSSDNTNDKKEPVTAERIPANKHAAFLSLTCKEYSLLKAAFTPEFLIEKPWIPTLLMKCTAVAANLNIGILLLNSIRELKLTIYRFV